MKITHRSPSYLLALSLGCLTLSLGFSVLDELPSACFYEQFRMILAFFILPLSLCFLVDSYGHVTIPPVRPLPAHLEKTRTQMPQTLRPKVLTLYRTAKQPFRNSNATTSMPTTIGQRPRLRAGLAIGFSGSSETTGLSAGQRDSQRSSGVSDAQPVPLERRYVNIPVPEHVDPDGIIKEASTEAVEVVRFLDIKTTKAGRSLFVVQ